MKATPLASVISTRDEPEITDQLAAILLCLQIMIGKMPMPNASGRVNIDISQTSTMSAYQAWIANAVSSVGSGQVYYLTNTPWNFADAGSARIYDQIAVA